MNIFITGATGFIGGVLLKQLASEGCKVRALYRAGSEHKIVRSYPSVQYVEGNILNQGSLRSAMTGCTHVYHLAAYASVWAPDHSRFFDINVEGSRNVLNAARELGLQKAVITSTAATLPPSNGKPVDEAASKETFYTAYEQTKSLSEKLAKEFSSNGLPTVIVNPPRVFGPGQLSESNAITKIIRWYVQGKWRFMPGDGTCIGNYAYVKDVAQGHILAMKLGDPGQRYILGGTNLSFKDFFDHLARVTGVQKTLISIPVPLIKGISYIEKYKAQLFKIRPLLTPAWVDKYFRDWELSSDKARQELGYQITPIRNALAQTVTWVKKSHTQESS